MERSDGGGFQGLVAALDDSFINSALGIVFNHIYDGFLVGHMAFQRGADHFPETECQYVGKAV